MPISKYNPDGTVDIYNTQTGEVKTGVKVEDLGAISPNLVAEYQAKQSGTTGGAAPSEPTSSGGASGMPSKITSEMLQRAHAYAPKEEAAKIQKIYDIQQEALKTSEPTAEEKNRGAALGRIKESAQIVADVISRKDKYSDKETYMDALRFAVSDYNKRAFEEGGKALTPSEQAVIAGTQIQTIPGRQASIIEKAIGITPASAATVIVKDDEKSIINKMTMATKGVGGLLENKDPDDLITSISKKPREERKESKLEQILKGYAYSEERAPAAAGLAEKGLLGRILGGAIKPGEMGLRTLLGGSIGLGAGVAGGLGAEGGRQLVERGNIPFLTQEQEAIREKPTEERTLAAMLEGVKGGAGVAPYMIPVGPGKQAIMTGAMRGGSTAFAEPEATLGQVAGGAAFGGLTEAVLANLMPFLKKTGKELGIRSDVKKLGKPTISEGGVPAINKWEKLGFSTESLDDLGASAQDVLTTDGKRVGEISAQLASKGVEVKRKDIYKLLADELDNAATPETRAPILKAIESVKGTFGKRTSIGIDEFYKVKQDWGSLGKWNELTPPKDQQVAKVFNKLYGKANTIIGDLFDENLSKDQAGIFKQLNTRVSAALDALHFAKRRALQEVPTNPLKISPFDILGGAVDKPGALKTQSNLLELMTKKQIPQPLIDILTKGMTISGAARPGSY